MGGLVYMQNLLGALAELESSERPYTLMIDHEVDAANKLKVDKRLMVQERFGLGKRIQRRLSRNLKILAPEPAICRTLRDEKIDVLFTDRQYKSQIRVPLISWIPDFQFVHLPEIVGQEQVKYSSELHRQHLRQSKAVLVSSNDVLEDLLSFEAASRNRAHVVKFVAMIPPEVYDVDPSYVCQKYCLPERFFYLPNQFWKHKNHELLVQALQLLSKRSCEVTVVCTGNTNDHRHPLFFSSLLTTIAAAGVHERIRILGLVSRSDVFQLARQSMAVLQPSLFEGWSTSIEEAKSLGKRVIASNLPVNQEQVPDADFFDRYDPKSLADCLETAAAKGVSGPDWEREEVARAEYPRRVKTFAMDFLRVIKQAMSQQ